MAMPSVIARLRDPSLLRYDLFLEGGWSAASDDARFDVSDPGTGESIGQVARATRADTRRAIDAAAEAFPAWAARPAKERSTIMRRWFDLMVEHADDLASILTA